MKQLPFIVLACVIALAGGIWFGVTGKTEAPPAEISGFAFPEPQPLANINLIDQNSEPMTEAAYADRWSFIYVGYTSCPDACPMTLATLNQLQTELASENMDDNVQYQLVSVDPHRDTPEKLRDYARYFNDKFTAATGLPDELEKYSKQIHALYSIPDDKSDPNYLVDHSSSIVLINPDAAVHAIFTPPQEAAKLTADFLVLREKFNNAL